MGTQNPANPGPNDAKPATPGKKRHRGWRRFGIVLLVLVVLLGIGRLFLPRAVRWYVNRTLDQSLIYQGRIGEITIHLWRGAYSIHDLRLDKVTGNVPVPFYSAKRVDFTMEWPAILHRKLVGRVVMEEPQLNFVDAPDDAESQTGEGGPWLKMIRDLFPFKINSVRVRNGSIHFRAFHTDQPVDVYLSKLNASVDDLTNINNDITPMLTTVKAKAKAMDQADFDFEMKLDPFSYHPTFHLATRLLGLDVTKTNDLVRSYGKFDFKGGWFDLVMEMDAKEGQIRGYIKPLFRNLVVFDLVKDAKHDNPLQFFWQLLVGTAEEVLKNQPHDQFGTLIPFTADETTTKPDVLAMIGNVLRNGFVRAYLPKLEQGAVKDQGINFSTPAPIEANSTGEKS
ncbi:MAG TPA: DUF748 domain-containing protein [Humisphaera sp.]|jgi:hypothetical protein|nr:DUF748 domain-containing protein [Humisphaera sp.]